MEYITVELTDDMNFCKDAKAWHDFVQFWNDARLQPMSDPEKFPCWVIRGGMLYNPDGLDYLTTCFVYPKSVHRHENQ